MKSSWNKEKHVGRLCECGLLISDPQRPRHEVSVWHRLSTKVQELVANGATYASAARELGLSRAYVAARMAKVLRVREIKKWKEERKNEHEADAVVL